MQKIVLLGATGSIGDQTLSVLQEYPDQFQVVGMSARVNAEKLVELCRIFDCGAYYLSEAATGDAEQVLKLEDLMTEEVDHLIVADHGLESYQIVLKALTMRKRVSIANKELIMVHGPDLVYLAQEQRTTLIPIDSEHNGIFQCLQGERIEDVRRVIITASGGPFLDRSWQEVTDVTVEEVLNHPNWSMGSKTTVDSATLVNKAFEVIETHQLFGIPYDQIEVRLHPESIVHSIVEFTDGNVKMLAYPPDMRHAIGHCLFYPQRAPGLLTGADKKLAQFDQDLHFVRLEDGRYPCFDFVTETARKKPFSLAQLVKNDQWAVDEFLRGKIAFGDILECLQDGLNT